MKSHTQAIEELKKGNVIIYPSESCYSFGCDAKNKEAVEKVHAIKQEGNDKAFILSVFNLDQAQEFAHLNDTARKLCNHFMPGPLTIISDKKEGYDYLSTEGIAWRILSHPTAQQLAKEFGSAIITTSVNIHGESPLYNIAEVRKQFEKKVSYIIDGGDLDITTKQSTIIDTRTKKILREGAIKTQEILKFLKP